MFLRPCQLKPLMFSPVTQVLAHGTTGGRFGLTAPRELGGCLQVSPLYPNMIFYLSSQNKKRETGRLLSSGASGIMMACTHHISIIATISDLLLKMELEMHVLTQVFHSRCQATLSQAPSKGLNLGPAVVNT